MKRRTFVEMLTAVALVTLVSGCVGTIGRAAPTSDLTGTWYGSFTQPGAALHVDEGRCVLQVTDDGTFTARVTPGPGANNLAKPSNWSGTVVRKGDRFTFRTAGPWITLVRSGDTLYGVANDPLTGMDIMIRLDRAGGR